MYHKKNVFFLKKTLYGLRQSPRHCYKNFNLVMIIIGYIQRKYDFYVQLSNGTYIYLLLYIVEMIIVYKYVTEINKVKAQLSDEFE